HTHTHTHTLRIHTHTHNNDKYTYPHIHNNNNMYPHTLRYSHTHTHTHTPSQPDTHTNGYIDVTKQIQHTGSSQQQQSDVHTLTDSLKYSHGLITQKGANKQCVHEQPEPHTIKHRGNYSN